MEIEFIPIENSRPPYGAPVLLKINGVVQHITYTLDGADETPDWFEPFYFDHGDDMRMWWHKVEAWALLPDWKD